jgi:hypothetical protein
MRNGRFTQLAVALAISFGCSIVAFPNWLQSSEGPVVVKAFVPVYPVIALGTKATGTVVVEVRINAHGTVTSARAIAGHKLLHAVSEVTAKRWVFAEDSNSNSERMAHLKFDFKIMPDKTPSAELQPIFMPPYGVEVRSEIPKLILTPSIDPPSYVKPAKSRKKNR